MGKPTLTLCPNNSTTSGTHDWMWSLGEQVCKNCGIHAPTNAQGAALDPSQDNKEIIEAVDEHLPALDQSVRFNLLLALHKTFHNKPPARGTGEWGIKKHPSAGYYIVDENNEPIAVDLTSKGQAADLVDTHNTAIAAVSNAVAERVRERCAGVVLSRVHAAQGGLVNKIIKQCAAAILADGK